MATFDTVMQLRDAMSVERVFGEPIVRDEVTVIPVAVISGGAGGGEGTETGRGASGSGGGFGLTARPLGVYVLDSRGVRWQPVVDAARMAAAAQVLALVGVLTLRSLLRARARR